MWQKLTDENIEKIKNGTLVCQKNPEQETIKVGETELPLDTIYKIEILNDDIDQITLKTNNVSHVTGISGTRINNRRKLITENWFADI